MSDLSMQGNPYIRHLEHTPTTDAEAQMNATLALAFEQRTANLIALAHLETIMTDATEHFGDEEMRQIAERLGLNV
jgi:hypothetical protein